MAESNFDETKTEIAEEIEINISNHLKIAVLTLLINLSNEKAKIDISEMKVKSKVELADNVIQTFCKEVIEDECLRSSNPGLVDVIRQIHSCLY